MADQREHWRRAYAGKREDEVGWYQVSPDTSLALIENSCAGTEARIIDVGGGASRLVDALLNRGFRRLTVLDIVEAGLRQAQERLGGRASRVQWMSADITAWNPVDPYDLWHDRGVFHFLTEKNERAKYCAVLERTLAPGGHAVIGTFAPDGPEECSGLPVIRYDAESLGRELGPAFKDAETILEDHTTPGGEVQHFQFTRFARVP
ncbi:MAG: SAM-dependent methyltransferase [Rhodospirillaceae bacterium]|jgi:SAM-dependent methyltransferase|nr:SAM-dependent methyltransferase [Rhodospirillaceae bacterium]|tara:strand:+ start:1113 stop:1730 length:618 start_codon:yes stop_codon:yes gene_type:complete